MKKSLWIICAFLLFFAKGAFASSHGEDSKVRHIYLLRHAEVQKSADRTNNDPSLSSLGRNHVEKLIHTLEDETITHFVTSSYKRTEETGYPVYFAKKDQNFKVSWETQTNPNDVINAILMRDDNILVVGHSNTIPEVLKGLGGPSVRIEHDNYSRLFLVVLKGNQFVSLAPLRY